ncbi:MAG: SRPBCC domain-containing protein [Bryobacteraceae bacterium]
MTSPGHDSVVAEVWIDAPPERIFNALTHQAELVRWFTDAKSPVHRWEIDARPGGSFRYFIDEETAARHGVTAFECHGEILEFDPPKLLVYTWIASWHADTALKTVVRWEISASGRGTLVRVTHSGLASEPAALRDYGGGWRDQLRMLVSFVEDKSLSDQ